VNAYIPVSGSTYGLEPVASVPSNTGGVYTLDAYAEYMGP
jgi:hypothetical protein